MLFCYPFPPPPDPPPPPGYVPVILGSEPWPQASPYPPYPAQSPWPWLPLNMSGWSPQPPHPSVYNPFWPYPPSGLPPDHLVWIWLATMDGGVSEDVGTTFKTKIVWYRRMAIHESRPGTTTQRFLGFIRPSLRTILDESQEDGQEDDQQEQDESLGESPETGRGHTTIDTMDFHEFSDPPSPIRGNFIPVSTPVTSPSPSPLHQGQQLSPINETVTETDEESLEYLITRGKMQYQNARDAYQAGTSTPACGAIERDYPSSSRRSHSRSPDKYAKSATPSSRSRSSSPVKSSARRGARSGQSRVSFTFHDSDDDGDELTTAVNSPSKQQQDYVVSPASPAPSLSRRRLIPDLQPIDVAVTHQEARAEAIRKGKLPVAMHVPEKDIRQIPERTERGNTPAPHTYTSSGYQQTGKASVPRTYSSSDYSQDGDRHIDRLSVDPLLVGRRPPSNRRDNRQSIFDTYTEWKDGQNKRASGVAPTADVEESMFEPDYHAQKKAMEMVTQKKGPQLSKALQSGYNGEAFAPLDVMFPSETQAAQSARKVSKTMGWVEEASPHKPSPPKNNGFFENLRKKAKEFVHMGRDQLKAPRHPNRSKQDVRERQLVISLDPREQSLLYCELEFILTSAMNSYIICQFNAGRLVTDKLKEISDAWKRRGRPKVVGFRYDLETQLDLVRLHVGEFRFYSRMANEAAIYGMIDMMRVNARVMRVRTYCQPDTVISKQILDTRNLLNLIGAGEDEHVGLASVTQFYRDAIAREKVFHHDAGERVTDSTRMRNADRHWLQYRGEGSGLVITPPGAYRYELSTPTPKKGSRHADHSGLTTHSDSRYGDRSGQTHQSRENSSGATTTSHSRTNRERNQSPDTSYPRETFLDMDD